MSGESVLVTGGSGFIGSYCILDLLRAGYRVRTTVRSPEREATVRELRDQLTQQGERSNESPLSDRHAYAIIQKACAPDFAGSLRLYKLYARAQGFAPLSE